MFLFLQRRNPENNTFILLLIWAEGQTSFTSAKGEELEKPARGTLGRSAIREIRVWGKLGCDRICPQSHFLPDNAPLGTQQRWGAKAAPAERQTLKQGEFSRWGFCLMEDLSGVSREMNRGTEERHSDGGELLLTHASTDWRRKKFWSFFILTSFKNESVK